MKRRLIWLIILPVIMIGILCDSLSFSVKAETQNADVITNLYFANSKYSAKMDGEETQVTMKVFLEYNVDDITSGLIEEAVSNIVWASSDPYNVELPKTVDKVSYSDTAGLAIAKITAVCKKKGTYTIIGKVSDELTARCTVLVDVVDNGQEDGGNNNGGSSGVIIKKKYITGKLNSLDSDTSTIKIGSVEYAKDGNLNQEDISKYLNKDVIATLTNNKIVALCEDDSTDLDNVVTTGEVEDIAYGTVVKKQSLEGRIIDLALDLNTSMDDYVEAFRKSLEKEEKKLDSSSSNSAAELRQADESTNDRVITMDPRTPDDVIDAVYGAYAAYLDYYIAEGKELGKINFDKIDFSKDNMVISTKIVNQIRNNIDSNVFVRRIGSYTITIRTIDCFGAYTGSIQVIGRKGTYTGIINTSATKTAKIMTEYINAMSEWSKQMYKKAIHSLIDELTEVSGISEIVSSEFKDLVNNYMDDLCQQGYQNVAQNILKMSELSKTIKVLTKVKDVQSAASAIKDVEKTYNEIKKIDDYTDDEAKDKATGLCMKKVNKIKNNLGDALFDYLYTSDGMTVTSNEEKFKTFKRIFIECPVEVELYDENNVLLGSTLDGEESFSDDLLAEIRGDVKVIYIPDNIDVQLKLKATDEGYMDYIVEQFENGSRVGRMNYYDVVLTEGEEFVQNLSKGSISKDTTAYCLKTDDGENINADEYIPASDNNASIVVSCDVDEGGVVRGDTTYAIGSSVELYAIPEDGYEFSGWYVDDYIVECGACYRFAAKENVRVRAAFRDMRNRVEDTGYIVTLGEKYEDFACAKLYKHIDGTKTVFLALAGAEGESDDYKKVTVNTYNNNELLNSEVKELEYDGTSNFSLRGVTFDDFETIELLDKNKDVICSVTKKDEADVVSHTATINDDGELYFDDDVNGTFNAAISTETGYIRLYKYTGTSRTLIIPAQVLLNNRVYSVTFNDNGPHGSSQGIFYYSDIESVVFLSENNHKVLGEEEWYYSPFMYCKALKNVDLSGLDTTYVTNMNGLFRGCESLENVNLDGVKMSNVDDMSHMFSGCKSLKTIDLSGLDTSSVSNMSDMFAGCSMLKEIDLSNFLTSNVVDASYMFQGCEKLENIKISGFDSGKLNDMKCMFSDCGMLKKVELVGMNTLNVKDVSYMFSDCRLLESIKLSTFNTISVTDMNHMFYNCNMLKEVDLSEFNTTNVTNMRSMFENCSALKSIDLSNLNTGNVRDMSFMFYGCDALVSLQLKGLDVSKVTDMSYMIGDCNSLEILDMSDLDMSNVEHIFFAGNLENLKTINYNKTNMSKITDLKNVIGWCNSLENIDLSEADLSGLSSMESLFYQCYKLQKVNLKNAIILNVTNMSNMFCGCSSLGDICIQGVDLSNVTDMSSMFHGCVSIGNIDLKSINTSNVTDMSSMFKYCSSLKNIDISNLNTSKVSNMNSMFGDCSSLEEIDLSNLDTSNVKDLGGMFSGCIKIKKIDLSYFNTNKIEQMYGMFIGCESVEEIIFGDLKFPNVTNIRNIFSGCDSLKYIDLSGFDFSLLTDNVVELGLAMFPDIIITPKINENVYCPLYTSYIDGNDNIYYELSESIPRGTELHQCYYITWHLDGGETEFDLPTIGKSSSSICIPNPVRDGYEFLGWTGSNGEIPQKNLKIEAGERYTLGFTANWEKKNQDEISSTEDTKWAEEQETTGETKPREEQKSIEETENQGSSQASTEKSTQPQTMTENQNSTQTTTEKLTQSQSTTENRNSTQATTEKPIQLHSTTENQSTTQTATEKPTQPHITTENQSTTQATTEKMTQPQRMMENQESSQGTTERQILPETTTENQTSSQDITENQDTTQTVTEKPTQPQTTMESQNATQTTTENQAQPQGMTENQEFSQETTERRILPETTTEKQASFQDITKNQNITQTVTENRSSMQSTTEKPTLPEATTENQTTHEITTESVKTSVHPSTTEIVTQDSSNTVKAGTKTTQSGVTYVVTETDSQTPQVEFQSAKKNAKSVKIPAAVEVEGVICEVTSIADNAFANNKKLTSVNIPKTVEKIGNNAFKNCTKLKKVEIPKNVTEIGKNAFAGCKSLTKVTFKGNKVTEIEQGAFSKCTKLTSVMLPKGMKKIKKDAFSGCTKLKKLTIKSTTLTSIGKNAFADVPGTAVAKVPAKKKKAYQNLFRKGGFKGTVK